MIIHEECPHCKEDIAFNLIPYTDCGDICYDIEIEDLKEYMDDEEIESNICEDNEGDYYCKSCGRKIVIYAYESVSVEKE